MQRDLRYSFGICQQQQKKDTLEALYGDPWIIKGLTIKGWEDFR